MRKILKIMISLSACICLVSSFSCVLANDSASIEECDKAYNPEEISFISTKYGVTTEYVEKYNSIKLIEEKRELLDKIEPTISEEDMGDYIIRKNERVVYLDESRKLPISTIDTQRVDKYSVHLLSENATRASLLYSSEHTELVSAWMQYVRYNQRVNSISDIRVEIIDTYGGYAGVGNCSESSSHSTGWRGNDAFARTTFDRSAIIVFSDTLTANTTYSTYGMWTTKWMK